MRVLLQALCRPFEGPGSLASRIGKAVVGERCCPSRGGLLAPTPGDTVNATDLRNSFRASPTSDTLSPLGAVDCSSR